MTRPKVPDDKRQRTAQACDSCKRRKQKCNGLKPCNTCIKRNLTCSYTSSSTSDLGPQGLDESPTKRRHIESSPPGLHTTLDTGVAGSQAVPPVKGPVKEESPTWDAKTGAQHGSTPAAGEREVRQPSTVQSGPHHRNPSDHELENTSGTSTTSGPEEEITLNTQGRLLQDTRRRLLYVGDAATLSYLQYMRLVVGNISESSPFTEDPNRHRIVEHTVWLPPQLGPTHAVSPDRVTAEVLVESFFTNTSGLVEVFDRNAFNVQFDAYYSDPLSVEPMFPCLLYLTFAVGLVLATPAPGSREETTIHKLLSERSIYAEHFFRIAKSRGDPVDPLEDGDFWSVQALVLMTVYSLAISKRNAAYALQGMATRSAFALGLHRQEGEIMQIYPPEKRGLIRKVWRSLFVLDRFVSACLGRPLSISEADCSREALQTEDAGLSVSDAMQQSGQAEPSAALNASFRNCRSIGMILASFYAKRKMGTLAAQEIADQHRLLSRRLDAALHWRRSAEPSIAAAQRLAIVHSNLLYCYSVILLTRPFFLLRLGNVLHEQSGETRIHPRLGPRMSKFVEACVIASYHTIYLVQVAYEANCLATHNPFVIHNLFLATLVVLSNEFVPLYQSDAFTTSASTAIAIMRYCAADEDPQAQRLVFILESFTNVVAKRKQTSAAGYSATVPKIPNPSPTYDPIAYLFSAAEGHAPATGRTGSVSFEAQRPVVAASLSRQGSFVSPTVPNHPTGLVPSIHSPTNPPLGPGGTRLNGVSPPPSATATISQSLHGAGPGSMRVPEGPVSDGAESLGTDAEFDFDSLWHGFAGHAPGAPGGSAHVAPAPHGAGSALDPGFQAYGMPPGPSGHLATGTMGLNVPFHPDHFA